MKRIFTILLAFAVVFSLSAQTKKTTTTKTTTTTTTKTTTKDKTSKDKKTKDKKTKDTKDKKTKDKKTAPTTKAIEGLKSERAKIQNNIKKQEQALKANRADVKKRLQNLMVLNTQIDDKQKEIETVEGDINHINGNIDLLKTQLATLQQQLDDCKHKYVQSLRYMTRHHSFEEKLMFVFSAHNFAQMLRRVRFLKEYASYQRAQGEMIKVKQTQIEGKQNELNIAIGQKNTLLAKGREARTALEGQQSQQQEMVSTLQKQQKTIQSVIDDQKKKNAALNAQIDKLVAEEVARQQAEARKKAEAEAAKKKAAELEKKRKAAEAAERENQRKIAAAKAEEKRLKEEAAKASAAEKAKAEQKAKEAEATRMAVEKKASAEKERNEREVAKAKESSSAAMYNSVDQKLSSNFESNKGRLPIPVTGSYRIVSHFGQYNVEGLSNVTLDNKGINILGNPGCQARSIFDGEVSGIANVGGTWLVLVRHGYYISVYCNLSSVSVSKGQHVSARQALGTVGSDNILQFQLRKETSKLNPEAWLGR